jgi:hypothetical protein
VPAGLSGRAFAAFNGLRWTLLYAGGVPVVAAVVGLLWMRARVRVAFAVATAPA